MKESTENALEMLNRAEMALTSGNFLRANRITRDTSGIIDRTQSLHRKFMKKLKKYMKRISDMEDRGYDIEEAMDIMKRAKERAMKAEYRKATRTINLVDPALERATYLPFPLLNKSINLISTIFYSRGKISYTVRIENPTEEPLGEIIMRPYFSSDDFREVPEKPYGAVGAREYKEYTFYLTPKEGKDWSLGVGREVLMEEGVVVKTKLSSREGSARYLVEVENNSDQVLRDIMVSPMTPGGLKADPPEGLIDSVGPFSSGSVTFDLYPGALDRDDYYEEVETASDNVLVIEDEKPYEPGGEEFEIGENEPGEDEEEDEEEFQFDGDIGDEMPEVSEPRDFTPVKEEYNLIEMAPHRIPEDVDRKLKNIKKRRIKKKKKTR